jgi:DnaJ-class molecular chaperone
MTHYDILGIGRAAGEAEIKKAYRRMIIAFHPDKYQGDKQFAATKTHEIIEAYTVLRDPVARRNYDNLLKAQAQEAPAAGSRPRKDKKADAGAYSHPRKAGPKGLTKFRKALIVIGIFFVVFVVLLFLTIMKNIYGI